jgi:hypothetical protein
VTELSRKRDREEGERGTAKGGEPAVVAPASLSPQELHIVWLDRQEVYLSWAGLISAFIITLAFLSVSGWLIFTGHEVSGTILGTVDIVGLVTVFVTGRNASVKSKGPDIPRLEDKAVDGPTSKRQELNVGAGREPAQAP